MEKLELTPVDIRHKEFPTGLAGYKKEEVREFLEIVSTQMEDLISQAARVEKKVPDFREEPRPATIQPPAPKPQPIIEEKPKATEDLISRTLIIAEQTKTEIIATAKKDAERILRNAELEAKKTIEEAHRYLEVLDRKYKEIKLEKKEFLSQYKAELEDILDKITKSTVLNKEMEDEMDQHFERAKKVRYNPGDEIKNEKAIERNNTIPENESPK